MKYAIAFLSLALFSCASTPEPKLYPYECAIFTRHGVQAKVNGEYPSEQAALEDAILIRQRLIDKEMIGSNTAVMCFLDEAVQE